MGRLIKNIVVAIVNNSDDVSVNLKENENTNVYELHVVEVI